MIKEFCDNCKDELEAIDEYTSTQSVKITVTIESARRDIPEETVRVFCSAHCSIAWLTKHKADYHHLHDKK